MRCSSRRTDRTRARARADTLAPVKRPRARSGQRLGRLIHLALPFALAFLAFSPNLTDYYLSDDFNLPYVPGYTWREFFRQFTGPVGAGQFVRPISYASMGIDCAVFAHRPGLSHVINIALHAINALLVGALAKRLTRDATVAFVATVLFTLHPAHPEAVSWLSGRIDVLCATFGLASLLAYVHFAEVGGRRWLAASTGLLVLSTLSKEASFFLPLAFVAYELLHAPTRRLRRAIPGFAVLALHAVHRVFVLGTTGGYEDDAGHSQHVPELGLQLLYDWVGFVGYGLVSPVNTETLQKWATPAVMACWALVCLFVGASLRSARHTRAMRFVLALTALSTLTAASLFHFEGLRDTLDNSRYLYFPSAGFCLAFGVVVARVEAGRARTAGLAALVALYGALLYTHADTWSRAADLSRSTAQTIFDDCARLPGPDPIILVTNAPDRLEGAYVWRNGLDVLINYMHPRRYVGRFTRSTVEPGAEELQFDVRDHVGNPGACLLVWSWQSWRLENESGLLRDASPVASELTVPRADGERWWEGWEVLNATTAREDGVEWVLESESDDPYVISPPMPPSTRAFRIVMQAPEGADVAHVFWAFDGSEFAVWNHFRVFALERDGGTHEYVVGIPMNTARELGARSLRVRIDPIQTPGQVTIESIAWETHDAWASPPAE